MAKKAFNRHSWVDTVGGRYQRTKPLPITNSKYHRRSASTQAASCIYCCESFLTLNHFANEGLGDNIGYANRIPPMRAYQVL